MSAIEEDIVKAKENLQNALGDRYINYMQSMKKWFAGKSTKQEFDKEAREIVTDSYVHLHNEFLLCIITKCNNFDSIATEAATKTIFPMIPSKNVSKSKKKLKAGDSATSLRPASYNLRFAPVDPIKHAPSIITASLETASLASKDFCLEFCARERSLPYAKMIHNRMLVTAFDYNLQKIDPKAVFLLAEATIYMLKNIITKLASRSKLKHKLRCQTVYDFYEKNFITDKKILNEHRKRLFKSDEQFDFDPGLIEKLKKQSNEEDGGEEVESEQEQMETSTSRLNEQDDKDAVELKNISNDLNNPMFVPVKKLPSTLYDLKNLLQFHKSLMPSHSVNTISMEKIICNMWHESPEDEEI